MKEQGEQGGSGAGNGKESILEEDGRKNLSYQ